MNKTYTNIVHVVGITVLAVLFARFVVYDLMSSSVFSPIEKANDFKMSDIYQSVAESKAVHQLSQDITIVAIDGYSRAEVLDALNLISEYAPSAIGLDVFFPVPESDNSYLLASLSSIPNLVCAGRFERNNEGSTFHHLRQSFFEDSIAITYGYVNLNASSARDVIREFVPYVITADHDTLFTMAAQLAKKSKPSSLDICLSRRNTEETIAFENIEFPVVPVADVLTGAVDASLLTGRTILVGDVDNINDTYLSPLNKDLPGVMFHAYALQTILSKNYIDSTSTVCNWLIAIFLCVLFTVCNLLAKYRMSNFGNLFVRIVQFVVIYLLVVIGCAYFARHHAYIDFSPAIVMIGFGAVAFDVWFGCVALIGLIQNKIRK